MKKHSKKSGTASGASKTVTKKRKFEQKKAKSEPKSPQNEPKHPKSRKRLIIALFIVGMLIIWYFYRDNPS